MLKLGSSLTIARVSCLSQFVRWHWPHIWSLLDWVLLSFQLKCYFTLFYCLSPIAQYNNFIIFTHYTFLFTFCDLARLVPWFISSWIKCEHNSEKRKWSKASFIYFKSIFEIVMKSCFVRSFESKVAATQNANMNEKVDHLNNQS